MRWTVVAILPAAACGRVGFGARTGEPPGDAVTDARIADAAPAPDLVTFATQMAQNTATATATLAPTAPGDLIVVGVTVWDGTPVAGIAASDASPFAAVAAPARLDTTSSELWYLRATASIDAVTVTMAAPPSGFDVWAAEFAHVGAGAPDDVATACVAYPPAVARAAATASTSGELVVGVAMLQYPAYVDTVDAPFTELTPLDGNPFAYAIAPAPGAYGPQWTVGMGSGMAATTCSTTATFAAE